MKLLDVNAWLLAAFAQAAGATLVTLDAGFQARYPSVSVLTLHS